MTFGVRKSSDFGTRKQQVRSRHPSSAQFFGLLKGRTNIWHSKEYRDLTPRSLVTALALLG